MSRRRRCRAHTLVEALVALVLAALVMTTALSLYRTQRAAHVSSIEAVRARDAAATALTLIARSVRMAGFSPLDASGGVPFAPLFGCSAGRPSGEALRPGCAGAGASSDGLLVRYVGDTISTWPTSGGLVTDCLGQGVGDGDAAPLVVDRYFVRASSVTGEPELYCEGSGHSGTAQPLVEGVERLRVRYRLRGRAAWDEASSRGDDAGQRVQAVEVCGQARGAAGSRMRRYTDCDGRSQPVHDGRARWISRRWLAVRNAAFMDGGGG